MSTSSPSRVDVELVERFHRRLGLAFGVAKGREVVLADQPLRGRVHRAASSGRGTRQARPMSSARSARRLTMR